MAAVGRARATNRTKRTAIVTTLLRIKHPPDKVAARYVFCSWPVKILVSRAIVVGRPVNRVNGHATLRSDHRSSSESPANRCARAVACITATESSA